jgi:nicotinamidase-related amidase
MTAPRDTALVVIDVQEEYFSGRLPIGYPPRDESLDRIGAAMDHASSAGIPIVVVRHVGEPGGGTFEPGTPAQELRPEIASRPSDHVIDKRLPGSFTGTDLESWLRERDINHVTIVGYMTNVCCDTTARQALHMGMGAAILHDAVGVPPMPTVGGGVVDPETLQRAALAPLGLIGVEMMTTDEWVGQG